MQPMVHHRSDSDDDDDPDYIPPTRTKDSGNDEPDAKRPRTSSTPNEHGVTTQSREAAWAEFQASLSQLPSELQSIQQKRMVKIEKRYHFAGEDIIEVKEVLEDSEEAKKWPLWHEHEPTAQNLPFSSSSTISQSKAGMSSRKVSGPVLSMADSSSMPAKPAKRPGPRKPKTQLAPLSGTQKAKKLTTLDKSAMDWRAHVSSSNTTEGLRDELEANRRGGGYLEKVEFLQRVESRKEEVLESNKGTKRQRQ